MLRKGMFISDRYEIIDKVGSGGMSDVYKAKCHKLNRFVAIKVLKQEFSEDKNFVSKFRVEAQSAAGLSHPNIVNVFDVGEDNGLYYIVMELIEGITLKKYIDRKGKLSSKEAVSILIQVAQGIEAAHNNHIIHRDIKPQNIIISKEGKVKVTDFGIARAASTNTISSNAMGSVHYISPEQAKGGFIDEKSDIYSLGITLFEMVTGKVPFEGDSTVSIALQHVQNELPSPKLYVPDLAISVEKIIEKCTQKKPDRRYLKVSSLIADLKKSLISPNEDFVQIVSLEDNGATRMISDEEVSQIRKESGFERQELDIPIIGKDNEVLELENDNDDVDDDIEDEFAEDENPKLDKIIAIGGIVTAVVIIIIVAFVVISFLGNGCSSSGKKDDKTTEETTLDAKHTLVPDIIGLKEDEAIEALKKATLGYKVKQENDNKIAEGLVISASEDEGTVVEKNSTITIIVSLGAKAFDVPDVAGKDKDEAKKTLKDLGLNVKIEYKADDTVEVEKVLSTEPAAYTQAKYGDDITVFVSSGRDSTDVVVPKVVGLSSRDAAKASLEANGLKLGDVSEEYSDDVPSGRVMKQDIDAGSKVPTGTAVNIWMSKGPEAKPTVPNLVDKTQAEAEALLKAQNLEANVKTTYSDKVAKGVVISQETASGTTVSKGTKVTFTVSDGPKPTVKPVEESKKTFKIGISKGDLNVGEATSGNLTAYIKVKGKDDNGEYTRDYTQDLGSLEAFTSIEITQTVDSTAKSAIITITLGDENVYKAHVVDAYKN